ncbi:cytochrome c reductase subunit 7(VI) [Cyanidioschyzon merolae strain 10D]|jgi:ubiquinol-cytochrome c reductase subunit 7|uniref:Cytochrome c reductase subunit 7(VI) n=1 Tax=Cyanidioschyzon merolae (strain NIES-3377 / 10D) TaxID=280699 RepID=M1US14_CYAM1|nr:cytochrome c reductase subunit 7(VI) [Cyanidioschyzon merolae strain 10D]BAM80426.1 cytochrome c reductase subunit 7(VI) [Cyanidioschyzon merolae strain 10D]|eukprot:XP_005536462.1 cytochrome c reductase subunit 7(VI) [Cyanidioschyzon merolae strain 10D]
MGRLADLVLSVPGTRPLVTALARWYRREVEQELRKFGLRYDDLLLETDPEVSAALEQLPPAEQELRWKRIKRALDLSMKKTYLAENIAQQEDVWNPYLRERVSLIKQKRQELIESGE